MVRTSFNTLLVASLIAFASGCTKEDSDSSSSGDSGSFRTSCGTLNKGDLENPIPKESARKGTATVLGANLLLFKSSDGSNLVKLQNLGVQSDAARATAAQNKLKALAAEGEVYYYQATKNCEAEVEAGASGSLGQVFSANGTNFSETLIKSGLARLEVDQCEGEQLDSCYQALDEDAQDTIAAELTKFLWKPVSDSNGKLAIHTGPYGTSVIVNGVTGTNQGPGNGYGSLARFSQPGCAYGANVQVKVIDERTGAAYTFNGSDTITIPNGCNRYCIKDGAIALCPKN